MMRNILLPFPRSIFKRSWTCCKNTVLPPIGLDELKAAFQTGKPLPAKPVLLTFDDGYADNFQNLFPVLQKRKVKALIFLVTDFIGKEPGYMTWQQVRQMQESGLVQFGSHTLDHARLRRLPQEDILRQLRQSKAVLEEKLGVACEAFCYPFGSGGFDKRVRPLVFQAGYSFDFSTKPGINPWPWKGKKDPVARFSARRGNADGFLYTNHPRKK